MRDRAPRHRLSSAQSRARSIGLRLVRTDTAERSPGTGEAPGLRRPLLVCVDCRRQRPHWRSDCCRGDVRPPVATFAREA